MIADGAMASWRMIGKRSGTTKGRAAEVTWRATKLRTKAGNLVILPNNVVAKEPIVNYSEPAAPFRLEVEVGASYLVPPNKVKAALMEAARRSSRVMASPPPEVLLVAFDASAITYRVRFWIDDYGADEVSRDEVRPPSTIRSSATTSRSRGPFRFSTRRTGRRRTPRQSGGRGAAARGGRSLCHAAAGTAAPGRAVGPDGRLRQRRTHCPSGRRGAIDVRRLVGQRERRPGAVARRGGAHSARRVFRGDVALDRRTASATVLAVGDVVVVEIGAISSVAWRRSTLKRSRKSGWPPMVRRAGLEEMRTATAGAARSKRRR